MQPPRKNSIATKSALLACLLFGAVAHAEPIGKVVDASGPLLARTGGGSIKVLVTGSTVGRDETLFTRSDTYVRVELTDTSSITLGPDTQLSVKDYLYHQTSQDSASVTLGSGRVQVSSGRIGTGPANHFTLVAGSTTVDIGHSTFIAAYNPPVDSRALAFYDGHSRGRYQNVSLRMAQGVPPNLGPGGLNPGLYVQVLDGMIHLSNTGGTQSFAAGQFGFTPSFNQPPVILPNNPGLQFTPPPTFAGTTAGTANGSSAKANSVDCEVR